MPTHFPELCSLLLPKPDTSELHIEPQTTEVRYITLSSQLTETWLPKDRGPGASWLATWVLQSAAWAQGPGLTAMALTSYQPVTVPAPQNPSLGWLSGMKNHIRSTAALS